VVAVTKMMIQEFALETEKTSTHGESQKLAFYVNWI